MPTYKSKALRDYEAVYGPDVPTTTLPKAGPQVPTASPIGSTNAAEYGSYQQALQYLTSRLSEGNEDVRNIEQPFAISLAALMQKADSEGIHFKLESAYRDPKKQQALRDANPAAAAAGMIGSATGSKHTKGEAVDLTLGGGLKMKYDSPQAKWLRDNVGAFSLNVPLQPGKAKVNEPWHIEPLSARQTGTPSGTRAAGEKAAGINMPTVLPPLTPKSATPIAAGTSAGMIGDPEIDKILATIRSQETPGSKDPYRQPNTSGSNASGAYQFMDKTWQGLTKQLGFGTEYKRAMDAPPAIQDKVAAAHVRAILKKTGGDIREVPKTWYIGHPGVADSYFPGGKGNTLTAGQYADKWMKSYAKTNPTAVTTTPGPGTPTPGALPFGGSSLIGGATGLDPLGLGAMTDSPFTRLPMDTLSVSSSKGYTPTLAESYKPADMAPTISMAGKFASMMNPAYVPPIKRTIYGNDAPPLPAPPPATILPDTAMPSTPLPKRRVGL